MSIDALEKAIEQLSPDELVQFRNWFEQFDAAKTAQWDSQIQSDVAAGTLDLLAEEALADFKAGQTKNL